MMSPTKRFFYLNVVIILSLSALAFFSYRNSLSFVRDPEALMTRFFYLKKNNPAAAYKILNIILKVEPNNEQALENLLEIQLSKKEFSNALITLNRLETINIHNDNYLLKKAFLYRASGNLDKACVSFNKALLTPRKSKETREKSLLGLTECFRQKQFDNQRLNKKLSLSHSLLDLFTLLHLQKKQQAETILNLAEYLVPNDSEVLATKGYYYIQKKELQRAIPYFKKSLSLRYNKTIALELSYLYLQLNEQKKSLDLYDSIKTTLNSYEKTAFTKSYINHNRSFKNSALTLESSLSSELYKLHANALKALERGDYKKALLFQKQSFALNSSSEMAMEIGYTLQKLNDINESYRFFDLVKQSPNKELSRRATKAIENLTGSTYKLLPPPYYTDLYLAPFYFSRFDLSVLPIIVKAGKSLNDNYDSNLYVSFRTTTDDRSKTNGELEQIYEDNVAVLALGYSNRPHKNWPMRFFFEAGVAKDLIWQNRNEYRFDVRSGLFWSDQWVRLSKAPKRKFLSLSQISELYFDLIYFSRYDNNVIFNSRAHHGFTLAQNDFLTLNAYGLIRGGVDRNKEFYNNLIEYGPGLSLTPKKFKYLNLSIEDRKGYYLPVNRDSNPYDKRYNNTVVQLMFYTRL